MSKYINADEAIEIARERHMDDGLYDLDEYCLILDFLDTMPAADIVDVVRCKDCKYANKERLPQGSKWFASCDHFNTHSVMADDYCSYGKRRESE